MTLIIGIKCQDGIVMGSDSAATMGYMGHSTIRQPNKKLMTVCDSFILGVSGPVGLAQQFRGLLEDHLATTSFDNVKPHIAQRTLQQLFWGPVEQEMKIASQAAKCIGNIAHQSALCQILLAGMFAGSLCLFELNQQCSAEEVTDDIGFTAIGSGLQNASPFLAFLKRLFFMDNKPTLVDGIFFAIWALEHSIDIDPGGVAAPIQIKTMTIRDDGLDIAELTEEMIDEHRQFRVDMEDRIRTLRTDIGGDGTGGTTDIPNT